MIKWLELPDTEKKLAYQQIGTSIGRSAFIIEKDWWVVQALSAVFELPIGKHLVFKGGTSLSKAWQLIERFSEDIDLCINREFFGFSGELNKSQRSKLRKAAGNFVVDHLLKDLENCFAEKGIRDIKLDAEKAIYSDQDPRIINIHYPNLVSAPGYILPRVQLEIGCRSLIEPYSIQSLSSLIDEFYPDKSFTELPIHIPTVEPKRTFLEKLFLLHEEFQRPAKRIRVNRLSRHLYDVSKLARSNHAEIALQDETLYEIIVSHRYRFMRIKNIDYNLHQPQTLSIVPPESLMKIWRDDYNIMLEQMIYESNAPSFQSLITDITELRTRINAFHWKMKCTFPFIDPEETLQYRFN